ncbi:MAG: hypothetical protein OQK04_12735, partial [Kangiellaceae bacterium]|nr:hypothetical protein [Kangiellaceae bacterium]MCW8999567.1 hypothetical protein [Kangiellaceae bacterium]
MRLFFAFLICFWIPLNTSAKSIRVDEGSKLQFHSIGKLKVYRSWGDAEHQGLSFIGPKAIHFLMKLQTISNVERDNTCAVGYMRKEKYALLILGHQSCDGVLNQIAESTGSKLTDDELKEFKSKLSEIYDANLSSFWTTNKDVVVENNKIIKKYRLIKRY